MCRLPAFAGDNTGETPLSFSALRETVDIRDSGRFPYHLQELTGHLLIHSTDGYSLHEDCCDRFVAVVESIDTRDAVAATLVITESI